MGTDCPAATTGRLALVLCGFCLPTPSVARAGLEGDCYKSDTPLDAIQRQGNRQPQPLWHVRLGTCCVEDLAPIDAEHLFVGLSGNCSLPGSTLPPGSKLMCTDLRHSHSPRASMAWTN